MIPQRLLRDCPKCGAHKGFACRIEEPGCPQHELAVSAAHALNAEVDALPAFEWPPDPFGEHKD